MRTATSTSTSTKPIHNRKHKDNPEPNKKIKQPPSLANSHVRNDENHHGEPFPARERIPNASPSTPPRRPSSGGIQCVRARASEGGAVVSTQGEDGRRKGILKLYLAKIAGASKAA